jgi:hypothetical protein
MTPLQISAFIDLFDSLNLLAEHAPFRDEFPVNAANAGSSPAISPLRQGEQPPSCAPSNAHPSDSDNRLATGRNRTGSLAVTAA